jgi:hypothetical protein
MENDVWSKALKNVAERLEVAHITNDRVPSYLRMRTCEFPVDLKDAPLAASQEDQLRGAI